ncbi:MAG: pyridoxamine 5'-phosphate oxidase [Bacteroidales bacterium]|nr:pyridoxamine 5'-phosphate oxidase [Bacteroidales bacterium]
MSINFQNIRTEFERNKDLTNIKTDPFSQFKYWLQDAIDAGTIDPTAFSFSTATKDGIPSSRILLLKEVDNNGFYFFSNYESKKAKDLEENPIAAILFFWARTERQVRIVGKVSKISPNKSDDYFKIRPKDSQLSSIISPQSQVIENREFLEKRKEEELKTNNELTRPSYWGGYCLQPQSFEFWQGAPGRLHYRYKYEKTPGNEWNICMLAP